MLLPLVGKVIRTAGKALLARVVSIWTNSRAVFDDVAPQRKIKAGNAAFFISGDAQVPPRRGILRSRVSLENIIDYAGYSPPHIKFICFQHDGLISFRKARRGSSFHSNIKPRRDMSEQARNLQNEMKLFDDCIGDYEMRILFGR
jgi:hypothetical protein